jgi:hypothetical protein
MLLSHLENLLGRAENQSRLRRFKLGLQTDVDSHIITKREIFLPMEINYEDFMCARSLQEGLESSDDQGIS